MSQSYRRDVDGLRAVAVLAVVLFHAGLPIASGGFVGVDVFFVISGYLITGLLAGEIEETGTLSFVDFYARRFRRLLPALIVVVLSTLALGAALLSPISGQGNLADSALATLAFGSNVYFWRAVGDYFGPGTDQMPLLHTWSLSVEEQFYAGWPALLLLIAHVARRRGWSFRTCALVALSAVSLATFAASLWATATRPTAAFYLTPFRGWEFGAGALLALSKWTPPGRRSAAALASLGLALIGAAVVCFGPDTAFPGLAACLPVAGSVAVIAGGSVAALHTRILGSRPLARLGQLSYSWYLWHWPLLVILRVYRLGEPSALADALAVSLALLLAELTYRVVEDPIRSRRRTTFRTNRGALVTGITLSVLAAGCAFGMARYARKYQAELAQSPLNPACTPSAPDADCATGAPNSRRAVLVWGDSHAERLMSLASAFGRESDLAMIQRSFPLCPPVADAVPRRADGLGNKQCGDFNRAVERRLVNASPSQGIVGAILVSRWSRFVGTDDRTRLMLPGEPQDHAGSIAALRVGLSRVIARLADRGMRVLLVAEGPTFPFPVPQCVWSRGSDACGLTRRQAENYRAEALSVLRQVADGRENVRVFDALDALCSSTRCEPTVDGLVNFDDWHHLRPASAVQLLPRARADLRWVSRLEP